MTPYFQGLALCAGVFASTTANFAQTPAPPSQPATPALAPTLSAPHWVVQHWQNTPAWRGTSPITLAAHQATVPAQPASLTKLLTAFKVLDLTGSDADRNAKLTVSAQCAAVEGTRVGYRLGEQVAIIDALQGMLAISGNDAACALAQYFDPQLAERKARFAQNTPPPSPTQRCPRFEDVGDFVGYMNLGIPAASTALCQWRNPHGLSQEGHLSTAQDIGTIAYALWQHYPEARPWLARKTYTWNGLTQANRNTLLHRDPSVDGLKTGHTQAAGYNLATTQNQRVSIGNDAYDWRLATVVLGAASAQARADDSAELLRWTRENYQPWRLYAAGDLAGHWRLKGMLTAVPLHYAESVWVVLGKTQSPKDLRYVFHPEMKSVSKTYGAGSAVGYVTVMQNGVELGTARVVTQTTVHVGWYEIALTWFAREWDTFWSKRLN